MAVPPSAVTFSLGIVLFERRSFGRYHLFDLIDRNYLTVSHLFKSNVRTTS